SKERCGGRRRVRSDFDPAASRSTTESGMVERKPVLGPPEAERPFRSSSRIPDPKLGVHRGSRGNERPRRESPFQELYVVNGGLGIPFPEGRTLGQSCPGPSG